MQRSTDHAHARSLTAHSLPSHCHHKLTKHHAALPNALLLLGIAPASRCALLRVCHVALVSSRLAHVKGRAGILVDSLFKTRTKDVVVVVSRAFTTLGPTPGPPPDPTRDSLRPPPAHPAPHRTILQGISPAISTPYPQCMKNYHYEGREAQPQWSPHASRNSFDHKHP